jgi:hypothetical protein
MGNPCNDVDVSLFYSATTISIGDGEIAPFWDSPWLEGEKPKDIAPLIYANSFQQDGVEKLGYPQGQVLLLVGYPK